MAKNFILKENVLSDNILSIPDKGNIFKNGYIAIIKEYEFQNSWSDKEIIKSFRKVTKLNSYLSKHYPKAYVSYEGTCLE